MIISELKPLFPEEYTDGGPLVIAFHPAARKVRRRFWMPLMLL